MNPQQSIVEEIVNELATALNKVGIIPKNKIDKLSSVEVLKDAEKVLAVLRMEEKDEVA